MAKLNIDTTGKDVVEAYGDNAKGKTFVITGPSEGGIGAELLITLASSSPHRIVFAGRNETKISPVMQHVHAINNSIDVSFLQLDLMDSTSIHKAAADLNASIDKIDVLINNAGIAGKRTYEQSKDGIEAHFTVNYLGHFLFTNLIIDKILAAKGVVLNLTSMAYTLAEVNLDDINFDHGKSYVPWFAYARSKTANILFSYALGDRLGGRVAVFAVDPGSEVAPESKLLKNSGVDEAMMAEGHQLAKERNNGNEVPPIPLVSMQQATATMLWASLDPTIRESAPAFLKECSVTSALPYANDSDVAAKLWSLSERLVGQKFDV